MKGFKTLVILLLISAVAFNFLQNEDTPDNAHPSAIATTDHQHTEVELETPVDPSPQEEIHLASPYCENPYQVTCASSWPSIDPSGRVYPEVRGEVRALRLMRQVIHEQPELTSDQVQDELASRIYTETRRNRALQVFNWVKSRLKQWIHQQPFEPYEREALTFRVDRVVLELPPPARVYGSAVDLVTKNAVYYERTAEGILRLRVGGAYLMNTTSWYNIAYTFAHELAHAIDPCELEIAQLKPKSYQNLTQCFVDRGWVEANKIECGGIEQISEAFADWLATEIFQFALSEWTTEYSDQEKLSAIINATRDLCEQSLEGTALIYNYHRPPEVRIGEIFALHPKLRDQLNCKQKLSYCQIHQGKSHE